MPSFIMSSITQEARNKNEDRPPPTHAPIADASVLLDGVGSHLGHAVPPAAHHFLVVADKFLVILEDVVDSVDVAVFGRVVLGEPEPAYEE